LRGRDLHHEKRLSPMPQRLGVLHCTAPFPYLGAGRSNAAEIDVEHSL
jgi:hypothetical protein